MPPTATARKLANVANLWPGMTAETSRQFTRIGRGLPIDKPNQFAQVHVRYYHQIAYPVGGGTLFNFFNVGQQEHVCNLNNGVAPDERPFWLTGVCITIQDLDAAGARSGVQFSGSAITAYARAEELRTILLGGLLNLSVGDRRILDVQDLSHFPSDGAPYCSTAAISFAAATTSSAAPLTNGEPIAGNRFKLPAPYPILPGKQILGQIKFQTALTITTAARVKFELVGESVLPLNV